MVASCSAVMDWAGIWAETQSASSVVQFFATLTAVLLAFLLDTFVHWIARLRQLRLDKEELDRLRDHVAGDIRSKSIEIAAFEQQVTAHGMSTALGTGTRPSLELGTWEAIRPSYMRLCPNRVERIAVSSFYESIAAIDSALNRLDEKLWVLLSAPLHQPGYETKMTPAFEKDAERLSARLKGTTSMGKSLGPSIEKLLRGTQYARFVKHPETGLPVHPLRQEQK